jgi:6-phosphogluconate dehydrogenase
MPITLLKSQFDALEEPKNVLIIDISKTPETIIETIRKGLNL